MGTGAGIVDVDRRRPISVASLAPARDGGVILVGHPNVGKSTLFQQLTGSYTTVANYPGTTVEVTRGVARFAAGVPVLDSPGIVGFPARSEDERVVSRLLLRDDAGVIVQVGDVKSLARTLLLLAPLAELQIPLALALNMADEADSRGVRVNSERLAHMLGAPVAVTTATRGVGVEELVAAVRHASCPAPQFAYPAPVETALGEIERLVPDAPVAPRGVGLLWLCRDEEAEAWLRDRLGAGRVAELSARRDAVEIELGERASSAIQRVWLGFAHETAEAAVVDGQAGEERASRLAALTTHRVWGWPILATVLYGVYLLVGVLAAGKLVGVLEEGLFGGVLNPALTAVVERIAPEQVVADFLVGEYGLWTMGMTYALALIFPIVTAFFLVFGLLEDSGYLPRLAVMTNRLFTALGLNGKAALPMIVGLGCVTMATLTTRVLESKRERLLATLLLALGIPCSAQLGVVLGMLGSISLVATLIWGAVVFAVVLAVGALAARLVPGERLTLLVELPPLRVPRASNVLLKTAVRVEWYLKEVVPLFLLGAAALFVLDATNALTALIRAAEPLVSGWLGLPDSATSAFVVGFLRRDFAATDLFLMQSAGQLTAQQALVAMVTITLFIPCVASVLVIARERGARTAVAMTATVFPLAFLVGGLLHRILDLSGWGA